MEFEDKNGKRVTIINDDWEFVEFETKESKITVARNRFYKTYRPVKSTNIDLQI